MSRRAKAPRSPRRPLNWDASDLVPVHPGQALWRIHKTSGQSPSAWNTYREYGPLGTMRWDPHPEPVTSHPTCAVLYTAFDLETCIGEVFQDRERIDTLTANPFATSWSPTRTLRLLDLTQGWPLRMGASHALLSAPRPICRRWAHAIWEAALLNDTELDGLHVRSTLTGQDMAVLFAASHDALPTAPAFTAPLNGPVLYTVASMFAARNGWTLI